MLVIAACLLGIAVTMGVVKQRQLTADLDTCRSEIMRLENVQIDFVPPVRPAMNGTRFPLTELSIGPGKTTVLVILDGSWTRVVATDDGVILGDLLSFDPEAKTVRYPTKLLTGWSRAQ
jgi:hypothetical protein